MNASSRMPGDLLIRGGLVHTPSGLKRLDVASRAGRIATLTPPGAIDWDAPVLEADGLVGLPGAVDAHVHFDEPGREGWEGWASGSLAAAAGGVTTVLDMPIDSDPPTVSTAELAAKRECAEQKSLVDFGLFGGLIDADRSRLEGLVDAGVIGFKAFLCDSGWESFPPADSRALQLGCVLARRHGLPLAVHCEAAGRLGRGGPPHLDRPEEAEVDAVRRVIAAAAPLGAPVHIVHASSPAAVAQAAGRQNITVETCAHYLVLDADEALAIGPTAWCAPPGTAAGKAGGAVGRA